MKTIEGHNVKIFTDMIDENAIGQIKQLLSIDAFADKKSGLCLMYMLVPVV